MNTSINVRKVPSAVSYSNKGSIVISAILAAAAFVFQLMNISSVVSACFYASIALVAINYLFKVLSTKKMSLYVLFILVLMLFSFAVAGFVFNFEVYKRAIIVICCILCIEDTRTNAISFREFRIIEISFLIATAFAAFMFYLRGYNTVFFKATNSVAMNFSNPNTLALWLTTFFIGLYICFFVEPHKFFKILVLIFAILMLPIISATESRNSLVSCVFVVIALIFVMLRSKKRTVKRLPKWAVAILTALPVLVFFAYMYIVIPNVDFFNDVFSFLLGQGKTLTSRAKIWKIVYDELPSCFFFGKYNVYYNEQMHNSLMTIYCMFGAPVTYLISAIFYRSISRRNIYSQIALLGIWLTGCFEASIFVGIAGIYLMLQILPTIGSYFEQNLVKHR